MAAPERDPITKKLSEAQVTKWKQNMLTNISHNKEWSPFIIGDTQVWGKAKEASRGFDSTNALKAVLIDALLEYIAEFVPTSIHCRITREATSLEDVWKFVRDYSIMPEDKLAVLGSRMWMRSEIVSLRKGNSRVFPNNKRKLELDMDNENNSVIFLAEFPEKDKLRQIRDIMKANDPIPCGPFVQLYDLVDTESRKWLDGFPENKLAAIGSRMSITSETVSLRKGDSQVFLNNNCKLELHMDNENNSVTFLAEFPEKDKLREILNIMKANDIVPCGPVVHLHDLVDTESRKRLGGLKATLSLRHYLFLPEIGGSINACYFNPLDKHRFVSFSEDHNAMTMKMHDCDKESENSASVKIATFSYWCFASLGDACDHQFPMDICILRPIGSSCPHEHSQIYFVATGTMRRIWREANPEDRNRWDDPAYVEREFEQMCREEQLELAARRVKISLPTCHNEYKTEIGLKATTVRDAQMEWENCGIMSIRQFIHSSNGRGISLGLHLERKFPLPNCETASHEHSYPYIRLLSRNATDSNQNPNPGPTILITVLHAMFRTLRILFPNSEVIARILKILSPNTTSPASGAPTKLFTKRGFSIHIRENNKCTNIRIPENEKPLGIAFVIGNSYHHSREHTLTSCPTNANKFKEYLEDTSQNLKYHWLVEPKINVTKEDFETLLGHFSNTALARNAEAICCYFSGHGIYYGREHYLILEDDERVSVDEIQRKIVNIFNSRRLRAPTKYYIFVIDVCRNGSDYSIQSTPSMLENTNNKEVFDHIFALWSTQRGDEAIPGDEESTFSQLLLSELRRGTEWNDLASRINENYQGQEGLYCSPTSCGTGFTRF